MPTPDIPPRKSRRPDTLSIAILAFINALNRKRRRPGKDRDVGGVPVEPNSPRGLSGGAAAPLDFENE
jgi:hypothetical protein